VADLIPPMLIQLQADVSQLKVGLAQAENALKGMDQSVQTTANGMTNFITKMKQVGASIGVAFAGTQVLAFGRDVIQQAQEAEAQQQRLYQLLKVGTGATDEQIASLNAQAEALQKVGVVTAGNITQTQSQLATFNLQTDTIKALTPAILDYVTAEKGASAGADEFKQMTNGLAQALNGNFGSLTRVGFVLDENTKKQISSGTEAQRAAAIVEVLNSTYKGFNEELRNTPEGRMQVLRNDFDQLKEDLGKSLLPALKVVTDFLTDQLIPGLRSLGKFFKDNSTIIIALTGAVIAGVVAWKAYQTAIIVTSAVTKAYTAIQTVMRTGTLVSIASTNGLAASMLKLNATMAANPIGVVVVAIAALVAGFVLAYKKSETFRNGVAVVAKAIISYVAFMIRAWGDFITVLMKVITGPLKLFLGVMSKIPGLGDAAKAGLKLVNGAIEGVGNFAEKTASKIEGLKAKVDSFTDAANKSAKAGKDVKEKTESGGGTGGGTGGGGLSDKDKKKMEKYKEDIQAIYKDMNEAIADAQERALEQLEQRNERMLEAHERYDERVAELKDQYNERMASAQERYDEMAIDAFEDRQKRETEILQNYKNQQAEIESNYASKIADLTSNYNDQVADLMQQAEEKRTQLIADAAAKRESLTQQSMDRLRNAFASKTGFNIGEAFSGGADSADKMLEKLKEKLAGAKKLQENAAALAGMGYSQTFIEQVVSQGPEAGNKIAEALKKATPESTKEMQELYGQIGDVSENGMDDLAKKMNEGGNLATKELRKAYNQVSVDLANDLKKVNDNLNANLQKAQQQYMMAMAAAAAERARRLEENQKKMEEALAAEKAKFDERMADALKQLTKSREEAQKDLDKGLIDAQKTLTEALEDAQKAYDKAIDKINSATDKKLQALRDKLKEISDLIRAIAGAEAALSAIKGAPKVTPIIPASIPGGNVTPSNNNITNINNNITANTNADPQAIANQIQYAIKYGQVVEIPGTMTVL
jgi:hypothetical protein